MKALIALDDGTCWAGRAFAGDGEVYGELVFNTSMPGCQEILQGPPEKRQAFERMRAGTVFQPVEHAILKGAPSYCRGQAQRPESPTVEGMRTRVWIQFSAPNSSGVTIRTEAFR